MSSVASASFSPREIVSELDRFIVGQNDAKRAVATWHWQVHRGTSSPGCVHG